MPEAAAETPPGAPLEPTLVEKPAASPATWPSWFAGVDVALAVLTVALGFLAASFTARNSDLWLHLGAGRMLTTGEYRLGSDPLSYTAADRPWVNHSWLFDLGSYLLYAGDGFALVLVKALAVAAAVGLVLAIRRPGQSFWPWAVFAVLAVLASAMHLTLRPIIGSIFFLALTLFLVFRLPSRPGSWRLPAAIGVTFWFWANVDAWFFLGPVALALLLVGELVRRQMSNGGPSAEGVDDPLGSLPDPSTLGRALVVGVVACMLNPHHVRVWELPFELVGTATTDTDPRIKALLVSPLDSIYRDNEGWGYNIHGLAYVLLLGAGLYAGFLSGAVGRVLGPWAEVDPLPLPHALLWAGFAALSLMNVIAIPFFALVTVPLVAARLNAFSGRVVLGPWNDRRTRLILSGSGAGRVISLVGLLALCVLAWPGWLYQFTGSNPAFARRVDWSVDPDPGLKQAAEWLREQREAGRLPADARGLLASVDLANYCAWYAPGEKVFANSRFNHHRPELAELAQVRRGLGLLPIDEPPDPREAEEVFRRRDVRYVGVASVITDVQKTRVAAQEATIRMWRAWTNWSPWFLDGRSTIAGWRPSPAETRPPFTELRVDPVTLAFGPGTAKLPAGKAEPVPPQRGLLDEFIHPSRPTPLAADEAIGWLNYKSTLAERMSLNYHAIKLFQLNVPGIAAPPIVPAMFQAQEEAYTRQVGRFRPAPRSLDGNLLAIPVLAVRAARRAIAADPNHPDGYYALALALRDVDLPMTETERNLGMVTAYRQCLSRMPPPADFRAGAFFASPAVVASELAGLYLNQPSPNAPVYLGIPVDLPGVRDLVGQMVVPDGKRNPRVPYGRPIPPNVQAVGPFLLPLDLARQLLSLAGEYAAREFVGMNPDQKQAMFKRLEEQRKRVDGELQVTTERFRTLTQSQPSPKDRFPLALQQNLVGEALETLRATKSGLDKEYGDLAVEIFLRGIALELAIGQLEEAATDITALGEALDKLSAEPRGDAKQFQQRLRAYRQVLRMLEYQTLLLAGNYAAAGAEMEAMEGQLVEHAANHAQGPPATELGFNWPIVSPPAGIPATSAVVFWYRDRLVRYLYMRQMVEARMAQTATFFYRRGVLSLLDGDIEAAAARFRQCRRPAPPGWELQDLTMNDANEFLKLIETARKKAGGP